MHISYIPPTPEPYYLPTGNEAQPKPIGEDCGIIVYQYYPISAVNYVSSKIGTKLNNILQNALKSSKYNLISLADPVSEVANTSYQRARLQKKTPCVLNLDLNLEIWQKL